MRAFPGYFMLSAWFEIYRGEMNDVFFAGDASMFIGTVQRM